MQALGLVDFERIKMIAKESKCAVRDLILSYKHDPFYIGQGRHVEWAQWFADVWQQAGYTGAAHLRRLHYWVVSQPDLRWVDGKRYTNTIEHWQHLCDASQYARYLGLVDFDAIEDHKNPEPVINGDHDKTTITGSVGSFGFAEPSVSTYGPSTAYLQPYHLEVWVEKTTMDDVLGEVCRRYCADLIRSEGQPSLTMAWEAWNRIREIGKPTRIFYISDFDPAGKSMPVQVARKLEWFHRNGDGEQDLRLLHLALTADQVEEYQLPGTPLKEKDSSAARFAEMHGRDTGVELDALEALHPGVLADLVESQLCRYWNASIIRQASEEEHYLRVFLEEQVDKIKSRYAEHLEALQKMADELEELEDDDEGQDDFPAATPDSVEGDADEEWLLDTGRDYLTQLDHYKATQGEESEQ